MIFLNSAYELADIMKLKHKGVIFIGLYEQVWTIIYWSNEDNIFVAEMPELKACIAHGDTQDEALKEANIVAQEWMKMARENGGNIPEQKARFLAKM